MELEKTKKINELLDLYGNLLTKIQLNTIKLYYQEDLSLSEIASELKVSRNAVYDSIKKSINILERYEKKLKLLEKEKQKKKLLLVANKLTKKELINEIEKL